MEDIARSLRRAEVEAKKQASLSSSAGKRFVTALLLLVATTGALATFVVLKTPYGSAWEEPLRQALARIPRFAKEYDAPASLSPLHHRLGGHSNHVVVSDESGAAGREGRNDDARCEMNGLGDCVMVSTPGGAASSVQLTEEEVAMLMEEEDSNPMNSTDSKNSAQTAQDSSSSLSPLELRRAAALGDEDTVATCLAHHPEWVDDADRNRWTPLHLAVRAGHVSVVRVLLKFGANVRVKTVSDESPMDMANKRLGSDHPVTQLLQSHAVWMLSQSMKQQSQPRQHS